MAQYLRDEFLKNLTITEPKLRLLDDVFQNLRRTIPNPPPRPDEVNTVHLSYIIRFDNKGYRVFVFEELLAYFQQADYVERVIFTVETKLSMNTNRVIGSFIELRLDNRDPNLCTLQVSADDRNWVDASFAATKDILARCKSLSWLMRGAWSHLFIQILGIFTGFAISLWGAVKIAPQIKIDNAFFVSFLFVLLIFSNLWSFLTHRLAAFVNSTFPNVRFYRPDLDKLHWLEQAIVGGLIAAVAGWILAFLFQYMAVILQGILFLPRP